MREWLSTPDEFANFDRLHKRSAQVRQEVEDYRTMGGRPDEQEMYRHFSNWILTMNMPGLAKAVIDFINGRRI